MAADNEVRVLVVDDVPDVADVISSLLKLDGHSVQTAYSGADAFGLVEQFHPHCIILDVAMPGMDGLQLSHMMRERYGDDVVLIAMTGSSQDDPRVSDTFACVDHYLRKPITSEQLRKVLPPS